MTQPETGPGEVANCPDKDARTMAMVVHLLAVFTGAIGALVIYFMKKDDSEFVRFHALQTIYFELVSIPIALVTCGIWGVAVLILNIVACTRASAGEWYEYPIVGAWARKK